LGPLVRHVILAKGHPHFGSVSANWAECDPFEPVQVSPPVQTSEIHLDQFFTCFSILQCVQRHLTLFGGGPPFFWEPSVPPLQAVNPLFPFFRSRLNDRHGHLPNTVLFFRLPVPLSHAARNTFQGADPVPNPFGCSLPIRDLALPPRFSQARGFFILICSLFPRLLCLTKFNETQYPKQSLPVRFPCPLFLGLTFNLLTPLFSLPFRFGSAKVCNKVPPRFRKLSPWPLPFESFFSCGTALRVAISSSYSSSGECPLWPLSPSS